MSAVIDKTDRADIKSKHPSAYKALTAKAIGSKLTDDRSIMMIILT